MHSRKFESKEALVAYAKQNGLTCLSESFAKWQQLLSPTFKRQAERQLVLTAPVPFLEISAARFRS
jgi:hypothetical protein